MKKHTVVFINWQHCFITDDVSEAIDAFLEFEKMSLIDYAHEYSENITEIPEDEEYDYFELILEDINNGEYGWEVRIF